jgi:hypothetical protein
MCVMHTLMLKPQNKKAPPARRVLDTSWLCRIYMETVIPWFRTTSYFVVNDVGLHFAAVHPSLTLSV